MRVYSPDIEQAKLQLSAAILNYEKEIEIYSWLALIVPEYGTKPFNKRFETWLNKEAMTRFGTQVYEKWGLRGEDKTVPMINFYMSRTSYSQEVKHDISFNYRGYQMNYDYDAKKYVLGRTNENERMYSVTAATELVTQAQNAVTERNNGLVSLKQNLKDLAKLAIEHDKVGQMVNDYNDKITSAISDNWRLR